MARGYYPPGNGLPEERTVFGTREDAQNIGSLNDQFLAKKAIRVLKSIQADRAD